MLSRFPNWVRSGLLLAMLAGSQTGCQTWKSPSFNMFPWSKKPSADKIVGTKPPTNLPSSPSSSSVTSLAQDSSKSGGPVSPATRNTPSPVPGTPMPNMAIASNPAGAVPSPGTAAANNGFTPGTYNTAQTRTNPAAPNPYAANPYGAVPNGVVPNGANPYAAMPNGSVSSASMQGIASGANPYGSTLPPGGSAPTNASFNTPAPQPNTNYQNNIPNLPPAYGGPAYGNPGLAPQGMPQGMPQAVPQAVPQGLPLGMPQGIPQGMPQMVPQGMPQGVPSLPSLPNSQGLPPGSIPGTPLLPSSNAPGMPSLPPASSSGAYRPGSVGRSTSYDFSGQNPVR
jgi:hypothetical protein